MPVFHSLLFAAVLAFGPGLPPIHIEYESPYPGALGLTCHEGFEGHPGNVQYRCPDGFKGLVLYPAAFRDGPTLLNVLAHEAHHFDHTEAIAEEAAYTAGCLRSFIFECFRWLSR